MKACSFCGELKSLNDFYLESSASDKTRRGTTCKQCKRIQYLGLTPGEFKELLRKANNCCEICQSPNNLRIDHCHVTGTIRGILCTSCNTSLGGLGDSIAGLHRAIVYLQKVSLKPNMTYLLSKIENGRAFRSTDV